MDFKAACVALALALLTSQCAHAQSEAFDFDSKPRWEGGLAGVYFNGHDYPGSADPNVAHTPLPFFIYRSKVFRIGDGGIGAVAVEQPRVKLDISFGGSLNAKSEPDSVRAGLPELDVLFEFGPRLQMKLLKRQRPNGSSTEITWDSKVRAVIATNFKHVRAQGFVFGTGLGFRQRAIAGDKIDLIANVGITFGDRRYNNNFYSVSQTDATAQREPYQARAGYVQSSLFLGLGIKPIDSVRIFTGIASFDYRHSANRKSPLFETHSGTQYVVGLIWSVFQSKQTIDVFKSE